MKVLFDNCTSPVMASTLDGFVQASGHAGVHIRDLPLHNPTDIEWMTYLSKSNEDWLVITGDQRIRKNKAEAQAFRSANLKAVILASAYQKTPMHRCCAVIVHQWPNLYDTIKRFEAPFMLEMSINFSGKFKQLYF
ncbi:hypothetical protein [Chelativorans sp. M5D2P16]|uniref:PIN-like domain-containing protein n=1 Tax=Chelativorans sp. M5D2P16 TaxID=3095678 RepID=UPI002ACA1FCC|nr:hypothetical protein [Chelativorans sp. M5D2P16]MDZ5699232.1 hypothetical protein [Chelativorans sp. M5D2P16]